MLPAVEICGIQEEELMEPMAVKLSRAYVTITSQLKEPIAAKQLVSKKTNLAKRTAVKPLPLAIVIHTVLSELMELFVS